MVSFKTRIILVIVWLKGWGYYEKQLIYILGALILLCLLVLRGIHQILVCKVNEKASEIKIVDGNASGEPGNGDKGGEVEKVVAEPVSVLNPATYSVEPIGDANAKVSYAHNRRCTR